jgi:glycerophosphoryl diester phosphodiesterase
VEGRPWRRGRISVARSSRAGGSRRWRHPADQRFLYPIVEGAFTDDPILRRRFVYEFDVRRERYTGRRWQYETDVAANVIATPS